MPPWGVVMAIEKQSLLHLKIYAAITNGRFYV